MYRLPSAPLITAQQINTRLDSLAQELKAFDFDVILSALTGSYMFTADLSRRIATPKLRIAFIKRQATAIPTNLAQTSLFRALKVSTSRASAFC